MKRVFVYRRRIGSYKPPKRDYAFKYVFAIIAVLAILVVLILVLK